MIEARNIFKSFGSLQVLKGVSLQIQQGEVVAIVGPSGAGKTTLLQILGTLDVPSKNKNTFISINKMNLLDMNTKEAAKFRNQHIGFVFQFHQLLPEFTALENVCIPAFIAQKSKKKKQRKNRPNFCIF